jgi:hypothetical protein
MLWLTQLAGRPISILPWFLKNNHTFLWLILKVTPYGLFPILKSDLCLTPNLRLVISLILVSRMNIRNTTSKCILANLLESLSYGNNSFRIKSTLWMISNTSLAIAPLFVYTWISNQLTHCVNSSVTWWPKTFIRVCSSRLAFQWCVPSWYRNQFPSMANLSHFVGHCSTLPFGLPLPGVLLKMFYIVFNKDIEMS